MLFVLTFPKGIIKEKKMFKYLSSKTKLCAVPKNKYDKSYIYLYNF